MKFKQKWKLYAEEGKYEGEGNMRGMERKLTIFGKMVAKELVEQDMSKVELAKIIGTTPQYLSCILNGTRSGKKYIEKIVETLELDKDEVNRAMVA